MKIFSKVTDTHPLAVDSGQLYPHDLPLSQPGAETTTGIYNRV